MSKQSKKYHLGMSGEYYVAAELQRRGISAAITYGNAKKADILATVAESEKAIVIEVKTTQKSNWIVGSRAPQPSDKIWVLVYIPNDESLHPEFFIMKQRDMHDILMPIQIDYFKRYKEKHGVEYGNKSGVCTLKRSAISTHKGDWDKIIKQLK